ncbi:MAG TPA: glutamate formimidoyltransferase [Actinomycetota bacterium]|nr:glutamate formimidoyltransferase [Actinomycetota bacterium]
MDRILGCAVNLSEGRRPDVVKLAAGQAASSAYLLDASCDADHNRAVITLAGEPHRLVDGVLRLAGIAVANIDLRSHSGVHPRLGAVDVVPFYPVLGSLMADAVEAARVCGRRLWEELKVPVFLYDQAAAAPETAALPSIRKHAFAGRLPDFGGDQPHPTAGASVVGARGLLVAYNVDLATDDGAVARSIAAELRKRYSGGVRALGFVLPRRGVAQVSMNIVAPDRVTLTEVFQAVSELAAAAGTAPLRSEIVGLVPRACLDAASRAELAMTEKPKVLEETLERLLAR